jgi:hypothetical protein
MGHFAKRTMSGVLFMAAVLASGVVTFAQECREQSPQEHQAIMRVLDTTRAVLEAPILAGDWQVDKNRSGEKAPIAINPAPPRPLMTCQPLYNVEFIMKPDSTAGKPHYDKWKAALNGSDPSAVIGAAHELNLVRFGVALFENPPYLREEIRRPLARLTIPGVPLAYRVTTPPKGPGDDPVVHTYLSFGDWSGFPFDKDTYVKFPFVHKPGSPNIETLRVNVSGLPEIVDPIIKKVDWSRLGQALSK